METLRIGLDPEAVPALRQHHRISLVQAPFRGLLAQGYSLGRVIGLPLRPSLLDLPNRCLRLQGVQGLGHGRVGAIAEGLKRHHHLVGVVDLVVIDLKLVHVRAAEPHARSDLEDLHVVVEEELREALLLKLLLAHRPHLPGAEGVVAGVGPQHPKGHPSVAIVLDV